MTNTNKKIADRSIRKLKVDGSTNLWGGIMSGLKLFKDNGDSGRVPAVMVLTDGQPNIGYVSDAKYAKAKTNNGSAGRP